MKRKGKKSQGPNFSLLIFVHSPIGKQTQNSHNKTTTNQKGFCKKKKKAKQANTLTNYLSTMKGIAANVVAFALVLKNAQGYPVSLSESEITTAAAATTTTTTTEPNIPTYFDTQEKWYGCGRSTHNQGQCGSCFGVSATTVLTERMCIFLDENDKAIEGETSNFNGNRKFQKAGSCTGDGTTHMAHNHGCKRTQFVLSPQAMLSCGNFAEEEKLFPDSAGCNGGEALDAWRYLFVHGLSTMTADGTNGCTPYTSGKCASKDPLNNGCKTCEGLLKECQDTGLPPKLYKVNSFGYIMEEGLEKRPDSSKPRPETDQVLLSAQVKNMQIELMTNGPIHVCIDYYSNFGPFFNEFPQGIYNSTENKLQTGGHCLTITGWGQDQATGMDYWIIKNSWGANWGTDGFFRYVRGQDLGGIESDVWAGCPEGTSCELTAGVKLVSKPTTKKTGIAAWDDRIKEVFLTNSRRLSIRGEEEEESEDIPQPNKWKGGYWHEISREDFVAHRSIALKVAHAYEQVFGEPTTLAVATAAAKRVWTQAGMDGLKVRVEFNADALPEEDRSHDKSESPLECMHHHDASSGLITRLF